MSLHLTADMQDNYDRFVRRVKRSGVVWGLKSDEGWAVCPSNEYDCDVYLFWSDEAYARRHCISKWAGYKPTQIPLNEFIDTWLKGMDEAGELAGTNFNADLAGLEVEPIQLAEDLIKDF